MYYFPYLDILKIKDISRSIGFKSHQIRNYTAGYVRIEYPEIQIVDIMIGQIEGIMRDIIGHIENCWDIKSLINNSSRPLSFLYRAFFGNTENSNIISAFIPEENRKIIVIQLISIYNDIKEIDKLVNEAILKDSDMNFTGIKHEINANDSAFLVKLENDFKLKPIEEYEKYEIKNSINNNFENLVINLKDNTKKLSMIISNNAHSLQNICSEYIYKNPENIQCNNIIEYSGQIEEKSREIIDIMVNYDYKKVQNIEVLNKKIYEEIINNSKKIKEMIIKIKENYENSCDYVRLKMKEEKFENIIEQEELLLQYLINNIEKLIKI